MYTFMVGPWLPTNSNTISGGLVHTPGTEEDGGGCQSVGPLKHFHNKSTQRRLLTDPSDALAPTLSPAAFQQTSKIPPVPL